MHMESAMLRWNYTYLPEIQHPAVVLRDSGSVAGVRLLVIMHVNRAVKINPGLRMSLSPTSAFAGPSSRITC